MTDERPSEKRKPGPKPEVFKVPLPFDEALRAAMETAPPEKGKRKKSKTQRG